jgi:heptosyltransferase-3
MQRSSDTDRILVITLSNIGDLILTTPVLEALSARYPGALIDLVADRRSSSLLEAAPYVGQIFHREKLAGWRAQWILLRSLRRRRYRLVVDLRTNIIPFLVRADQRLIKRAEKTAGLHAAEQHFAVLKPILDAATPPPCRLHLDDNSRQRARDLLAALPGDRWLALGPGANWPGKRWPGGHYLELLRQVASTFDGAIIVGTPDDVEAPLKLDELPLAVADLSGRTDLITAAAVISHACAFVGNDSGLGHIAAALDVPTLTLFGPGEPTRYRPWGSTAHVALAPGADLKQLTVEAVADALNGLL